MGAVLRGQRVVLGGIVLIITAVITRRHEAIRQGQDLAEIAESLFEFFNLSSRSSSGFVVSTRGERARDRLPGERGANAERAPVGGPLRTRKKPPSFVRRWHFCALTGLAMPRAATCSF